MHRQAHRAHDRVEGPVFVRVVMCSWQWKHVNVTGPSDSSVGTTSWVATGGGALYSGPTSTIENCKQTCKQTCKQIALTVAPGWWWISSIHFCWCSSILSVQWSILIMGWNWHPSGWTILLERIHVCVVAIRDYVVSKIQFSEIKSIQLWTGFVGIGFDLIFSNKTYFQLLFVADNFLS